jgi:hypothetical protein
MEFMNNVHRCVGVSGATLATTFWLIVIFGEPEREREVWRYYEVMSNALHTCITALLPPACAVRLTDADAVHGLQREPMWRERPSGEPTWKER